jgi:hypothetical protein
MMPNSVPFIVCIVAATFEFINYFLLITSQYEVHSLCRMIMNDKNSEGQQLKWSWHILRYICLMKQENSEESQAAL